MDQADKQEIVHARRWVMQKRHYKEVSQWLERAALVVAASLVIQKIVSGASILSIPHSLLWGYRLKGRV